MSDLAGFHNKVREYLHMTSPGELGRATQTELAGEIGLTSEELSRRLRGSVPLTSEYVKKIVKVLVKMRRIRSKSEARYLLNFMDVLDFDPPDWDVFPLNQLGDAEPLGKPAPSSDKSTNDQIASNIAHTEHVPLVGEQKDRWQTAPRRIKHIVVHYRFFIGTLLALTVVIALSLAGLTLVHLYIESKSLIRVDWNNFIYPGLCNPNHGEHLTVQNGTAIDSGSLGKFFVQVYRPTAIDPTTFGDLTGDGQAEAIVPYGCSDTDPNSPMKGTVYVHALIFSGDVAHPVLLGQFPALSGQVNRDFASVDYVYIDHEELHLIGEGFSGAKSTIFDRQITMIYRWVRNQFERDSSQITPIASLPLHGNGQKLAYACPGMTEMWVQGNNQDKKNSTWGPYKVANGGLTWDYWWVGSVQIIWKDQAGKVHTNDHVSVPQQYTTYIYYATCT